MHIVSSSTYLTKRTPLGIFRTITGSLFWVFWTVGGRVAVQLDDFGPGPRFGFFYPGDNSSLEGYSLGGCTLQTYESGIYDYTPTGFCGALLLWRGLVYLKANHQCGQGKYLRVIGTRCRPNSDQRRYDHSWFLQDLDFGDELIHFDLNGSLPRMSSFSADVYLA